MTTQTFSSIDYYKNHNFIRLMRNWNKYLDYDGDDVDSDDIMAEWEETLIRDFLQASIEWLENNRSLTYWRKDLR